jgi:hypothetical protein
MTFEAFTRSLAALNLLPDVIIRHATQAAEPLDDGGRALLFHGLKQEYGQYEPLVQRKLLRMEHLIAEAGTRRKPHVPRPAKDHEKPVVQREKGGSMA